MFSLSHFHTDGTIRLTKVTTYQRIEQISSGYAHFRNNGCTMIIHTLTDSTNQIIVEIYQKDRAYFVQLYDATDGERFYIGTKWFGTFESATAYAVKCVA